jgi:hypothetical protein
VLQNVALLFGDFGMNSYKVNDDEAMKRDDEALNTSLLHCYDFLLFVYLFIGIIF